MKFTVEITDRAFAAIRAQAKYITIECESPLNAARWLERVWDAIGELELFPERHALAAEDEFKPYEVRRALVGDYLVLFTIEKKNRKVWVIGFRHGSRLPRPGDLPKQSPGETAED